METKEGSSQEQIRKMQREELELIKVFKEICDKEKLQYFMIGGTMLGAVRHKGFIPWDDDADFMMPREDYEQFLKLAPAYLKEPFHLGNYLYDSDYFYYFTKMSTSRYKIEIPGRATTKAENLAIDIFPWDGMPKNPLLFKLHPYRILAARALYAYTVFNEKVSIDTAYKTKIERFLIFIGRHINIGKLFSKRKRWLAFDNVLKKYPTRQSEWYIHGMGWIMRGMGYEDENFKGIRDIYRKDMFGEGAFYEFEGLQLRGPKDYDTYLKQHFGDYMTVPPEAERREPGHKVTLVEAGNGGN